MHGQLEQVTQQTIFQRWCALSVHGYTYPTPTKSQKKKKKNSIIHASPDQLIGSYLRVEIVHQMNRLFDIATLNGCSDNHAVLNRLEIDRRLGATFLTELFSCILIAFNDKVVHDQLVEVPKQHPEGKCKASEHLVSPLLHTVLVSPLLHTLFVSPLLHTLFVSQPKQLSLF